MKNPLIGKKTYLCQWQTTQGNTHQWCTKEDLPNPNNILLDHNLLLIAQYQNITREQEATQAYPNYLNYTQTKDKKTHTPPLNITNLKTYMQECNPDKDILTNKSTIQI